MKVKAGQVVKNLKVISYIRTDGNLNRIWLCECLHCGKQFERSTVDINRLKLNPCGCVKRNPSEFSLKKQPGDSTNDNYKQWDTVTLRCHFCDNELKTSYRTLCVGAMLKCANEHGWTYDEYTERMMCPQCIKKSKRSALVEMVNTSLISKSNSNKKETMKCHT